MAGSHRIDIPLSDDMQLDDVRDTWI